MNNRNLSPKLNHWRHSIAHSGPDRIPAVPTITLDDLIPSKKVSAMEHYDERDWYCCNVCLKTGAECKLLKCAGCSTFGGARTLYCSRKCQRVGWLRHKQYCQNAPKEYSSWSLRGKVDLKMWQSIERLRDRRNAGMKQLGSWAIEQIYQNDPTIDIHEKGLVITCRSSLGQGRGYIVPVAYQLVPIHESVHRARAAEYFAHFPGELSSTYWFSVDGFVHDPQYVDLNIFNSRSPSMQQWPWIVATISAMKTYNQKLSVYRLDELVMIVALLVGFNKQDVIRFSAPPDFPNGRMWYLYDFEDWQGIFGHVIGF